MAHDVVARRPIFVTGATGFIGRRVLAQLRAASDRPIRCLTRAQPAADGGVEIVRGDLTRSDSYAAALAGVETVLHLAAKTGQAARDEHFRVNAEGTATLVRACRQAGVPRLVMVSSIAATYTRQTAYHYAESKREAEQIVRSSGLTYVIVRPTLVFGSGSPIETSFARLAALPVVPIFGDGRARVQPIHVDDVAAFLVRAIDDRTLDNREIDLGGPEVVSFEELMRRMRRATRGDAGRFVHLPGAGLARTLAWIERRVGHVLPLSAGQLSVCLNDSTAAPEPLDADVPPPHRRTIDQMIGPQAAHG